MIVVEGIDLRHATARVRVVGDSTSDAELTRFSRETERLGLRCAPASATAATDAAPHVPGVTIRLISEREPVVYELSVARDVPGTRAMATALGVVLATYGPQENDLMRLRVALYEIVANATEHGRRDPTDRRDDRVTVELTFGTDGIVGAVRDRCTAFDPAQRLTPAVKNVLDDGHPRGLGLPMIRRLLDETDHSYQDDGNVVRFRKRICS